MAGISSGKILSIEEVKRLNENLIGQAVRTWGRIIYHNINTSQVKIKDGANELTVETSLVEPLAFVKGSLYHFIGEIITLPGVAVVLKARIAGCIDGMDMALFQQALEVRRNYLKEEIPNTSL